VKQSGGKTARTSETQIDTGSFGQSEREVTRLSGVVVFAGSTGNWSGFCQMMVWMGWRQHERIFVKF
jgi:hypothetical protein